MQTPNPKKWTADCRHIKALAQELNQARNLVEAWNVLGRIDSTTDRMSALCAFPEDPDRFETLRESKRRLSRWDEAKVLKEPFDLRANYGKIRDLILEFAAWHGKFTVDALGVWLSSRIGVIPRRVLSANLYSLATKGSKPLARTKQGKRGRGSDTPAVYALRKR
jgi:hypothetical protein